MRVGEPWRVPDAKSSESSWYECEYICGTLWANIGRMSGLEGAKSQLLGMSASARDCALIIRMQGRGSGYLPQDHERALSLNTESNSTGFAFQPGRRRRM